MHSIKHLKMQSLTLPEAYLTEVLFTAVIHSSVLILLRKSKNDGAIRRNMLFMDPVWVSFPFYMRTVQSQTGKKVRECLHDTGATFAPARVHPGSLSWFYICLHDTTTKCHAGTSHPGVSSAQLLYRGENFTPLRNFAKVSCKREMTTRFGVKSVCRWTGTGCANVLFAI